MHKRAEPSPVIGQALFHERHVTEVAGCGDAKHCLLQAHKVRLVSTVTSGLLPRAACTMQGGTELASHLVWGGKNFLAGIESLGQRVDGLEISAEQRGDNFVVTGAGDLDIVTSPALDEWLKTTQATGSRVVLDLSGVDFMDTSALAVIVGHWKRLEATGGSLALAGARYRYTKTLWITGLADRLSLYDSVDAALTAGR